MTTMHSSALVLMHWIVPLVASAQFTVLQPVVIEQGRSRITVGCDTAQVFDRKELTLVKEQCANEEALMDALIKDMQPNGAKRTALKAVLKEQKAWTNARDKHCANEVTDNTSQNRDLIVWNCREWADRCRLEELVRTYDRLVPGK